MSTYSYRQAKLLQEMRQANVTIEDLARAWSSLDGKREKFDAEKDVSAADAIYGHYLGYIYEMEEIIERATRYAQTRKQDSNHGT